MTVGGSVGGGTTTGVGGADGGVGGGGGVNVLTSIARTCGLGGLGPANNCESNWLSEPTLPGAGPGGATTGGPPATGCGPGGSASVGIAGPTACTGAAP